jgi:hypothetical protein
MRKYALLVPILAVIELAPGRALPDGGAVTLAGGPALTVLPLMTLPVDGSPTAPASTFGGILELRYAPGNHFEIVATGFYDAPARLAHVTLNGGGALVSRLTGEVTSWGALLGLQYVSGLTWRFHIGGAVGWRHEGFAKVDGWSVYGGSATALHSGMDALVLSVVTGLEWQVSDRLNVTVLPSLQFLVGGAGRVAIVLPVTLGYSWYLF